MCAYRISRGGTANNVARAALSIVSLCAFAFSANAQVRRGVDYSFSRPNLATLKQKNYDFVIRYVGGDASKVITKDEAAKIRHAVLDLVLVYEGSDPLRMRLGKSAGVADANEAVSEARNAGLPADFFCYFAWDPSYYDFRSLDTDLPLIYGYLDGAASVLGASRVGFYGFYAAVKAVLDNNKAAKAWQTSGQSPPGTLDIRAVLYQNSYNQFIFNQEYDGDIGNAADIGQIRYAPAIGTDSLNGVPVGYCPLTVDGTPVGSTDYNGNIVLPNLCGSHLIAARRGNLWYSQVINFVCPLAKSAATDGSTTTAADTTPVPPGNEYLISLASDASCANLTSSVNFNVGDIVEVYGTGTGLRARYPDPCSESWIVMPDLSTATVVGASQCCNGYVRWKLRYDDLQGIEVWSAEGEPSTGQMFLRKKQPTACSYSLSPNRLDLDTAGAAASAFNVAAGASCSWTASASQPWVTVTQSASGSGSQQVTFSVAANVNSSPRSATISVFDQVFTITQPGSLTPPSGTGYLSVNPSSFALDSALGGQTFAVSNPGSAALQATMTSDPWITLSFTNLYVAPGYSTPVSFSYLLNPSTSLRSGKIFVNAPGATNSPQSIDVVQAGQKATPTPTPPPDPTPPGATPTPFPITNTAPKFLWAQDPGYAFSGVATDDYGNNYVVGTLFGTATIGGKTLTAIGSADVVLAKFDATGKFQWVRQVGASSSGWKGSDWANGISVDRIGNVYITGHFTWTIAFGGYTFSTDGGTTAVFLTKYNANGDVVWANAGVGASISSFANGQAIAADRTGNCYVTGQFKGSIAFGTNTFTANAGDNDIFVTKYDTLGNFVWFRQAGGSSYDQPWAAAVDANSNCYITGYSSSPTLTFGNVTVTRQPGGTSGSSMMFAAKYDKDGNIAWATGAASNIAGGNVYGFGIGATGGGETYVSGAFQANMLLGSRSANSLGSQDAYTCKIDASGSCSWLWTAGSNSLDSNGFPCRTYSSSLAVDRNNNCYVAGFFTGTTPFANTTLLNSGGKDVFVTRLDQNGVAAWAARGGGSGDDQPTAISVDASGNAYLIGSNGNPATFGTAQLTGTSFLAKLGVARYRISVTSDPSSLGTVAGGGIYEGDSTARVFATPSSGQLFNGWYENGALVWPSLEYDFPAESDRSLIGSFVPQATPTPTATPTATPTQTPAAQPLNISTRMEVLANDNVLIAGFIVTGSSGATKKVMIRGLGPSLAAAGVPNPLSDPLLELHDGTSALLASNDDWRQASNLSDIPVGFQPTDPRESVIVATLTVGSQGYSNYSAVLRGAHGETGVGLVEAYDLQSGTSQFANISTRGFIDKGDNVMIAGFILGGSNAGSKVLIRAIAPSLPVSGALADPTLEIHDSNGTKVKSNDNWKTDDATGQSQEAAIRATTIPPSSDLESAVLDAFAPGAYTAVVAGKNGGTGVGLVEVYNLR